MGEDPLLKKMIGMYLAGKGLLRNEEERMPKFSIGERVKVVRLLDDITSRELIGMVGIVEEIDKLSNGEFNYYISGHYMHEEELERVGNLETSSR